MAVNASAVGPAWRRPRGAIWPLATGIVIAVVHIPEFVHRLLDGDEAVYGSIAVLMNLGAGLYGAGGVDNKPPGVFWIYAVTFRMFGAYQMTAIHAVGFLVMGGTCVLLYLIARDIAGPNAGLLAALFYGVLTAAGNPRLLASNTEVFMMLPLTASVLFMLRRRWLWAGLMLVAAGAFRQSAAFNVFLLVAGVVWLEPAARRWRATGSLGAGVLVGLVAGATLIALTGSLFGFWRWTVQTLVGYASANWIPSYVWERAKDSAVPFVVDMAVLWIAAIALMTRWRQLDARARLVILWLGLGLLGAVSAGHLSWHYFIQAMGPLAAAAALAFERFRPRRLVTAAAAAGLAVPTVAWWIFNLTADPLTYDFSQPPPQHQAVANYIVSHTSRADRVFIWGDWPAVYAESDRTMASRFPGFLRGFDRGSDLPPNSWDVAPDVWPMLQGDFDSHPPALIVDTASAGWSDFARYPMRDYPVLARYVAAHYHQVAVVDRVVIYARNG